MALYRRNLGDALARLGRAADAREAWGTCVRLATGELAVDARDVEALSTAAVCEAKLGRTEEARARVEGALTLAADDPDVLHGAAVVSAISGRREEAVERLLRALDHGLSRIVAQHDDELGSTRQDPRIVARLTGKRRTGGEQ
jgi:serine/threonine-protein kinase